MSTYRTENTFANRLLYHSMLQYNQRIISLTISRINQINSVQLNTLQRQNSELLAKYTINPISKLHRFVFLSLFLRFVFHTLWKCIASLKFASIENVGQPATLTFLIAENEIYRGTIHLNVDNYNFLTFLWSNINIFLSTRILKITAFIAING